MDDCDFVQQCPRLVKLDWSPSTRMAFPSCTVTHTPHSIFPQARQTVRTRFTSLSVAVELLPLSAKAASELLDESAAALAVAKAIFVKLRRDRFSLSTFSPSLLMTLTMGFDN